MALSGKAKRIITLSCDPNRGEAGQLAKHFASQGAGPAKFITHIVSGIRKAQHPEAEATAANIEANYGEAVSLIAGLLGFMYVFKSYT